MFPKHASRFSPEFELLLACCRWPASAARNAAIRQAAEREIDWSRFEKLVARHRVEGLVHDGLTRSGVEAEAEVATRIGRSAARIAHQNLQFAAEAMRLKGLFEGAGIAFYFLKGVTLNILAYDSLALKAASDIDVAVDPERYADACRLMERAGFSRFLPAPEIGPEGVAAWLVRSKHTIWVKPQTQVVVEVHSAIVDNSMLLPRITVHSPQQQVEVARGMALPTLQKHELFAYLCVHGSAHAWSRLKWLADVAALLQKEERSEVERLYRRSIDLGAGRTAAQALILCSDLLAFPLRPDFEAELRSDRAIPYLARVALSSMNPSGPVAELEDMVFGTVRTQIAHFFMVPSWSYKTSEFRRKFAPVSSGEAQRGPLAALLSPLYRIPAWLLSRVRKRRLTTKPR